MCVVGSIAGDYRKPVGRCRFDLYKKVPVNISFVFLRFVLNLTVGYTLYKAPPL